VSNTSVNLGRRNSGILTRLQGEFCLHLYGISCPCHIVHTIAKQGCKAFFKSSGFDVEELTGDLCYWLDELIKRKAELESYSQFCDVQYKQILDICSTRLSSLQAVIKRVIDCMNHYKVIFSQ